MLLGWINSQGVEFPPFFRPFIIIWHAFNVDITIEELKQNPSRIGLEDITAEGCDITIEELKQNPSRVGLEDITSEGCDVTIEDITNNAR